VTASICEFSFFLSFILSYHSQQHRFDRGSIINWSPSASSSASYGYNTSSNRSSIVNWSQTASSSLLLYRMGSHVYFSLPNLIQHRSDRGSIINWSPSASSSASYGYNPSSDHSSIVNWSQTASSSLLLYRFGCVFVLFLSFSP
jgi:hypothetical protein